MKLWEILVPREVTAFCFSEKNNREVAQFGDIGANRYYEGMSRHHKEWDEYVRNLTGGLTILKSTKGHWVSDTDSIMIEDMIPVRICCNTETIQQIANFTKEHYQQQKVMYYKLSDDVYFV